MLELTINGIKVNAPDGCTIMEAAKLNGIQIPSLCYLENIHSIGSCRICVVEVEGAKTLQASCIAKAKDGMVIHTNTERVRRARKIMYELLLSDHNADCLNCSRNQACEFQELGKTLGVDQSRFEGEKSDHPLDASVSVTRDMTKCILCRRCVTACGEIQGVGVLNPQYRGFKTVISPAMQLPIGSVNCTFCGQCTVVCPVGAVKETSSCDKVWKALNDKSKRVVVQVAPAVRVAVGEMFGMKTGSRVTGKLASSLRMLGFDDVFDTNWAADLTIIEEGTELLQRLKGAKTGENGSLPMITSCSPGWIKYIEHTYPYETGHLSSCKSPHMMLGSIVKSYYASKLGIPAKDMFVVSVMPCTAKKTEISRPEMRTDGLANVDAVITTRELGEMIKEAGIDFVNLPDGKFDEPLGLSSGAADIFGLTGGVMEAALRTVYELVTGRELPFNNLHVTPIVGLDSIKEAAIQIEDALPEYAFLNGTEIRVAVTSGLKNADVLMKQIVEGRSPYHFIEVMGCPGGCITGGGQPRSKDSEVRRKRLEALYDEDESKTLRKSHENPAITAFYGEFLGKPNGYLAHELLHTHYTRRGKYNELTDEDYSIKIRTAQKSAKVRTDVTEDQKNDRLVPKHSREELESVRVLTLEAENMKLKGELNQAQEMLDILRMVVADYAERK